MKMNQLRLPDHESFFSVLRGRVLEVALEAIKTIYFTNRNLVERELCRADQHVVHRSCTPTCTKSGPEHIIKTPWHHTFRTYEQCFSTQSTISISRLEYLCYGEVCKFIFEALTFAQFIITFLLNPHHLTEQSQSCQIRTLALHTNYWHNYIQFTFFTAKSG